MEYIPCTCYTDTAVPYSLTCTSPQGNTMSTVWQSQGDVEHPTSCVFKTDWPINCHFAHLSAQWLRAQLLRALKICMKCVRNNHLLLVVQTALSYIHDVLCDKFPRVHAKSTRESFPMLYMLTKVCHRMRMVTTLYITIAEGYSPQSLAKR